MTPAPSLFSTLLVLFGGDRQPHWKYYMAAWGLAAAISGLLLVVSYWSSLSIDLWGIWLYVLLAASVLAVELSLIHPTSA